jgi:hypothetical protein
MGERLVSGRLTQVPQLVAELRRRLTPLTEDEARAIYDRARERWPVRTGRSREGLFLRDVSEGDVVAWQVGNDVDYARFVKSTKLGRKLDAVRRRAALTEELGNPVRLARKRLVTRGAAVTVAVLEGRGG